MSGVAAQRMGWVPAPQQGWVAPHIASEFPGLGIAWVEVDAKPGRSPDPVRSSTSICATFVSPRV